MPLDQVQEQKIQAYLQRMFPAGLHCALCRANNWQMGPDLVVTTTWHPQGVSLGGGIQLPMIQLACINCGNVLHFAAKPMGVIPAPVP